MDASLLLVVLLSCLMLVSPELMLLELPLIRRTCLRISRGTHRQSIQDQCGDDDLRRGSQSMSHLTGALRVDPKGQFDCRHFNPRCWVLFIHLRTPPHLPTPLVLLRFKYDNHLVSLPRFAQTLMGGVERQVYTKIDNIHTYCFIGKLHIEWHLGELFPRVGFIITNSRLPATKMVKVYKW
jgi:hypothetical protein